MSFRQDLLHKVNTKQSIEDGMADLLFREGLITFGEDIKGKHYWRLTSAGATHLKRNI